MVPSLSVVLCAGVLALVRFVDLIEQDKTGSLYVWGSALCVAQHPDIYYMNVGAPNDKVWPLKEFAVPKGYAVITELSLPDFAVPLVKANLSKGKKTFAGCAKTLVVNHALFSAILPNQGPPSFDFKLPASFDQVLERRKKATGKGKGNAKSKPFDPLHLMYPLYPENDQGDSMDFENDGACMFDPYSIKAHRISEQLPPILPVVAQQSTRGGERGAESMQLILFSAVLSCFCCLNGWCDSTRCDRTTWARATPGSCSTRSCSTFQTRWRRRRRRRPKT
jgi:hypothetical protein